VSSESVKGRTLARSFYRRDSRELAPMLLNKLLVHDDPALGRLAVRIVEVEAYAGSTDPASHAYRGRTPRNATMFGPPGHLYVYFTYGMHFCMNVVAGAGEEDAADPGGDASAVLLRAAAPVAGIDAMRGRRPKVRHDRDLTSGPGRLAQALGVTRAHDGIDLTRGPLRVLDDGVEPPRRPGRSTRVGLREGRGDRDRWRWWVPGEANVSRAKPSRG
jgi:DNA-3-methyladenine glycosylase